MKKNFFISLLIFFILSLSGIIIIQFYWISSSLQNKEQEFSMAVGQIINSVAKEIEDREFKEYIDTFQDLIDSVGEPRTSQFKEVFMFLGNDEITNLSSLHTFGILEEEYNITRSEDLNTEMNRSKIKDYKGVKTTTILKDIFDKENRLSYSVERLKNIDRINAIDKAKYKTIFMEIANTFPVHKRIDALELDFLLNRKLKDREISTQIEFVVHSEGIPTKVRSNNYNENVKGKIYSTPIFLDDKGFSKLELIVSFPRKDKYVYSSVIGMAGLSFLLTIIVVILSSSSLYLILKQKKISEIKSDFINNMSHEFKTPIATINLAVDSILSSNSSISDKKISKYLSVITEENKRMHGQIENILKISQLERGTNLSQNKINDIHLIINNSLNHIALIVANKNGKINKQFDANNSFCFVDEHNLTNVFINIFDNAIKYSVNPPRINVSSKNFNKRIIIKIKDEGIGMSKKTKDLIFKKFYREQTGNIHDVKGHGLGLTYVKNIIEGSGGKIEVESELNKGSVFIIELPIN